MFAKWLPALAFAGIMVGASASKASAEAVVTRVAVRPPVVVVERRPYFYGGWRPERRVVVYQPYHRWYWERGVRCWR